MGGAALGMRSSPWAVVQRCRRQSCPHPACEEEGLILSITTFDGKSESKPFLKCFGHT